MNFRRWLFKGFVAISLALFVETTALWARSYWFADTVAIQVHPSDRWFGWVVTSDSGTIYVGYGPFARLEGLFGKEYLKWDGFRWVHYLVRAAGSVDASAAKHARMAWLIPHWVIMLVLLLPGWMVVAARKRLRATRAANGQCIVCGHDMRITPERCPVCGAASVSWVVRLPSGPG